MPRQGVSHNIGFSWPALTLKSVRLPLSHPSIDGLEPTFGEEGLGGLDVLMGSCAQSRADYKQARALISTTGYTSSALTEYMKNADIS